MSRFNLFLCAGLLTGFLSFAGSGASLAQTADASPALREPEQRVALVIGNSNYRNAPRLENPDNDAQSMAQLLNSAGFEVISATDLTQNDMLRVVQDFSAKVAARGPNAVAMVYYAGHGVQLAGENYLVPVDARISSPGDLVNNSVRLVDVMATLEAIPSRLRIVLLDACRNNPFPEVNDAGRGLAIVDAPNGSIVGYSTAPGTEALDGSGDHSPYTSAFLKLAREPNLPIEQLFKRVRLEVNNTTNGKQIPWESSSLTSDFYFFGDTAVAATRPPNKAPVVQMASNLPNRSVRQAYDYVLSEGSPEYYQEFITLFPHDPLCERIRWLLREWQVAQAWHKAVLANSPFAYKTFYDNYANSPYAQMALKLEAQPKALPLMQATHLIVPPQLAPALKPVNFGVKDSGGIKLGDKLKGDDTAGKPGVGGQIVHMPPGMMPKQPIDAASDPKKIVTLPAPNSNATTSTGSGKIITLPVGAVGKATSSPDVKTTFPAKRMVDAPLKPQMQVRDRRETVMPKLNGNSQQTGRGTIVSGKVTGTGGASFAQSNNQGRRGFIR